MSQNKNTHLNQAIHEEQEAILELRVQLRLLQSHKLQQEIIVQPLSEPAPPVQPSPEPHSEEQTKRSAAPAASGADAAASSNGKAAKDPSKPSPSKDRRDSNMWDDSTGGNSGGSVAAVSASGQVSPSFTFALLIVSTQWSPCYTGITCLAFFVSTMQRLKKKEKKKREG